MANLPIHLLLLFVVGASLEKWIATAFLPVDQHRMRHRRLLSASCQNQPSIRRFLLQATIEPNNPQDSSSIGQLEWLLDHYEDQQQQRNQQIETDDLHLSETEESAVKSALTDLAASSQDKEEDYENESELFDPLIGNYKVLYTLPSKPNERPVGGKWARRFKHKTKASNENNNDRPQQQQKRPRLIQLTGSWQHLAPPTIPGSVAQAINLITLNILGGALRLSVVLQGNAYRMTRQERQDIATERQTPYGGLSERTVQVDFDPPRIVLQYRADDEKNTNTNRQTIMKTLLCFNLGPVSSVILDTPFSNGKIRLGKGSRGSLFVFGRDNRAVVQDEWTRLLALRPTRKWKLLLGSSLLTGLITWGWTQTSSWLLRVLGVPVVAVSFLSTGILALGSGGIERDRDISALDAVKMRRTEPPLSSSAEGQKLAP